VVNGWANYVCDGLNVWRGLERVIMAVTGRIPRADEAEWLRRLGGGSSMLADPQRPAP